jgi:hypothetical protein
LLGARLILNSLGFLLQWPKGITRRIDALQQARPEKALNPAKPLILHRVGALVHDEGTLSQQSARTKMPYKSISPVVPGEMSPVAIAAVAKAG